MRRPRLGIPRLLVGASLSVLLGSGCASSPPAPDYPPPAPRSIAAPVSLTESLVARYSDAAVAGTRGVIDARSGRPRGALVVYPASFTGYLGVDRSRAEAIHAQVLRSIGGDPAISGSIDVLGSPEALPRRGDQQASVGIDPAGLDPEIGEPDRWLPEDVLVLRTEYQLIDAGEGERLFRLRGQLTANASGQILWSGATEQREVWDRVRANWVPANR